MAAVGGWWLRGTENSDFYDSGIWEGNLPYLETELRGELGEAVEGGWLRDSEGDFDFCRHCI